MGFMMFKPKGLFADMDRRKARPAAAAVEKLA